MGSSKKVTVGYKYYLGMHMVLCHGPVDAITKITVDDKVAWSGTATGGPITIAADNLFGGESREGGVSGIVDVEMGVAAQGRNAYLQSQIGNDIPAFRGVLALVLNQVYVGLNPYLKRWGAWAKRIAVKTDGNPQWYLAKSAIGDDMNPAHIIRECLTDIEWGMGYSETEIDDTSFTAAADQLHTEGMGISLLWDRSMQLDEFIGMILKHIDGALYVSRTTGKFVLSLARDNYSIGSLLTLDENSIHRITDFKRNAVGELTNSVTVVYWDSSTGKNNSVTVQDIALAAQQQTTVGTTVQYPGFTNGTIAAKVAARDLKALSIPLARGTIYATRKAAGLNIGDVFVLSWARFGLTQIVMRVMDVELGSLESNVVKLTVVEDVFALSSAVYAAPPPSGWVNPNNPPAACPYHVLIEAPYWELVQRMGETDAEALPATFAAVLATGVRPTSDAINAKVMTNPTNTAYEEAGTVDFCPTATLSAAVAPAVTTIPITGGVDLDIVRVGSYALIDNEFVSITSVSSSSLGVGRGVLDSIAAPHALGARIYFIDDVAETDGVEYSNGEAVRIKLLPTTGQGTLLEAAAPLQSLSVGTRQVRPYPPGQFRIGGLPYPDAVRGDADIPVSWAHRDRLQQTATLVPESTGSIGPEAGTTYTAQVRLENGSMITALTGITGPSHMFTLASLGSYYGRIRVELYSVRDGYDSHQKHDWLFTRAGYGAAYGYAYGGV